MVKRVKCNFSLRPETDERLRRIARADDISYRNPSDVIDSLVRIHWKEAEKSVITYEKNNNIPSKVEKQQKKYSLKSQDKFKKN